MANNETPLVSIVIPAYNVESTVIETLDSVVAQTYNNIETIIVDDGSTDNTLEIVKQFITDKPTMHVYTKGNEGLAATRNYGFQFVKGKYLLFLDADDLIDLDFVKLCVDEFNANPHADIITTEVQHFERETHIYIPPAFSLEGILRGNCFVITSMIKSEAFSAIGMFDTTMKFHEDWEMWLRMTEQYNNVIRIDKPLFWYRKRKSEDSLCDMNNKENISEEAHAYLYAKHYKKFSAFGYSLNDFFKIMDREAYYRKKYNNIWYRKLFYRFFPK